MSGKDLPWARQVVATWDRWTYRDYTIFKVNFEGLWYLRDSSGVIFTDETLQSVMEHASALEARRGETGTGSTGEASDIATGNARDAQSFPGDPS